MHRMKQAGVCTTDACLMQVLVAERDNEALFKKLADSQQKAVDDALALQQIKRVQKANSAKEPSSHNQVAIAIADCLWGATAHCDQP